MRSLSDITTALTDIATDARLQANIANRVGTVNADDWDAVAEATYHALQVAEYACRQAGTQAVRQDPDISPLARCAAEGNVYYGEAEPI